MKSKAGSKGGKCGGGNNYQVDDAHVVLEKLLNASEIIDEAIEDDMEKLKETIELQQNARKEKSGGGKYSHYERYLSLFFS